MDEKPVTWEQLIESALSQESTTTSGPSTRCQLILRPQQTRRHQVEVHRTVLQISQAVQAAIRSLVAGEAPWPLFLHGPAGTGKTCAALCVLDHCKGEYFTASSLCEWAIEAMKGTLTWKALTGESPQLGDGMTTVDSFWRWIASRTLIVLDEVGCRGVVSDHHYDCVKRMLDVRFGKPLIVLSNGDLAALEHLYDDRISSRLCGGTVLKLSGKDRRLQA